MSRSRSKPQENREGVKRDRAGQFLPGTKGGPGRPRGEVEYLAAMTQVVSMGEWSQICERAVKDAMKGDAKARSWLSRYLLPNGGQRDEDEMPEAPPLDGRDLLRNLRLKCHQKRTR